MTQQTNLKAPVTERALLQRVNRRLAKSGGVLRKALSPEPLGAFFVVDTNRNIVANTHVDLEKLGRELGVLRSWEEVAA